MTRLIRPYDFILDARVGWQLANAGDSSIEEGSIRLQTQQNLLPSLTEANGSFGGFTLPRGVAIWQDEVFIADASRHCIWHWRPCCGPIAMLPTVGGQGSEPRQLNTPLGLTISHREDLVVADSENRRLLIFTLPGLALRRVIGPLRQRKLLLDAWVLLYRLQPIPSVLWLLTILETAIWHPIDVTSGPDGTLYVADDHNNLVWRLDTQGRPDPYYSGQLPAEDAPQRLLVDRHHRVYVIPRVTEAVLILDRYGNLMPAPNQFQQAVQSWFTLHYAAQAKDPNWQPTFEQEAEARAALWPPELSQLIDVKISQALAKRLRQQQELARRSGQAIDTTKADLWQEQRNDIYEYLLPDLYAKLLPRFLQQVLPPSRLRLLPQTGQQQIEAWLSDRNLEATVENQQRAHGALLSQFQQTLDFTSPTSPKSDRILLLAQTCLSQSQFTDLTIDAEGRLQLPDGSAGPYIIHRPPVATFNDRGIFQFQPLDSQRVGNPWHRVVLELTAPERTSIRLFSFTSDIPQPNVTAEALLDDSSQPGLWQTAPANAEEWLIQSPPGRYLYLALVLRGPGDRTPSVERIYVYKERQSSLQYLPPLYQADETSRDLLDRWLSLFDTIFAEIESTIEDFPRYLDVQGAPVDFLPWLASWFDLKLLPTWDEAKRRQFLQEIVELYQRRGTIQGLRKLLQLHANLQEPMPQIVEHACGQSSNTDESPSHVVSQAIHHWLGATTDAPHHFSILMPAYTLNTPDKRLIIERLVDANKPAHTHFTLRAIYPGGVRLSSSRNPGTGIQLDSLLGSRRVWQLASAEASDRFLGEHSVLPDLPMPKAVTGKLGYSRIGIAHLGGRHCPPCED